MLSFRLDASDIDRFSTLTDKDGPIVREELGQCWMWTGHTSQFGHGQFRVKFLHARGHRRYAGHGAHRVAWLIDHPGEEIPSGMVVRHRCDNPPCVNPDHLELGTYGDNSRDMYERGRAAVGIRHGQAKLTDAQVRNIRQEYAKHGTAMTELARLNDVTDMTVRDILTGKSWRHITGGHPVNPPVNLSERETARRRALMSESANGPRGESHHFTPLTESDVVTLRQRHVEGARPGDLAAEYGITSTAVIAILKGRTWRSVTNGISVHVDWKKREQEARKIEVLRLRSEGATQQEVADQLGITQAAVSYLERTAAC